MAFVRYTLMLDSTGLKYYEHCFTCVLSLLTFLLYNTNSCATGTELTLCFVPLCFWSSAILKTKAESHILSPSPPMAVSAWISLSSSSKLKTHGSEDRPFECALQRCTCFSFPNLKGVPIKRRRKTIILASYWHKELVFSQVNPVSLCSTRCGFAEGERRVDVDFFFFFFAMFAHFMPSLVCCVLFTFHWKLSLHYHGTVCLLN